EHQEARGQGHDRRRGVHGALRPAARVHAGSRRLRGPGAEEGPVAGHDRRDAQGGDPGSLGHHERIISGEEGRARGRGASRGPGGRPDQAAATGEAQSGQQSSVLRRRLEDTRSASGGVMQEIDPMADWLMVVSALLGGAVAAGVAFYTIGRRGERRTAAAAAHAAAAETERLLGETRQRVVLAAKEELMQAREGFEEEAARRRRDIERHEQLLEQRLGALEERARGLELRGRALEDRDRALAAKELEARARLEQIAGLTAQEAKQELLRRLEDEARNEAAALARDLKEQARQGADKEAKKILALAIQRLAPEATAESTVSAVALPSDEMKGRIIGR